MSSRAEQCLVVQSDEKTEDISMTLPVTLPLLISLISSVSLVTIGLHDICGNKLVGSCPAKISLKVIGGDSSCAQKVPWNVLVELVTGPKVKAAGNRNIFMISLLTSEVYKLNQQNSNCSLKICHGQGQHLELYTLLTP